MWRHSFPHNKSTEIFSDTQGQLTQQSVLESGQISYTSKLSRTPQPFYKTDHFNTVLDISWISVGPKIIIQDSFSYLTVHFTLAITGFGQQSQKLAWTPTIVLKRGCGGMSQLPTSMKNIQSKTAEKTWQHNFPHYNHMGGAICCHGNQSSDPIWSKSYCCFSQTRRCFR